MSRVFAISNRKGGVAKTTSALNIGAALARLNYRVVLVDLDPQANLTRGLGIEAEQHIYGALLGDYRLRAYPAGPPNLALVPGSPALSGLEKTRGAVPGSELLLRQLLEPLADRCDFFVLDCPPALDLITLNAYACAQEIYVPLEAQLYAVDGLELVLDLAARVRAQLNPELRVAGAFFTRYDGRKVLRRDTARQLRATYPDLVLETAVRESIALAEAPHAHQDIFTYAALSAGAADYQALVAEILSR